MSIQWEERHTKNKGPEMVFSLPVIIYYLYKCTKNESRLENIFQCKKLCYNRSKIYSLDYLGIRIFDINCHIAIQKAILMHY